MQVYRKLAFALGNITMIGLLLLSGSLLFIGMSPKTSTQALTFIETEINAALYWNHVQKWVGEPEKKQLFCADEKHCYVVALKYAWYGAPQVKLTNHFSDGFNFQLRNGSDQAWRVSSVRLASQADIVNVSRAEPGAFQTKTMKQVMETWGGYKPTKEGLQPEDVVVEHMLTIDSPFDAFALKCPDRVVNGMSPAICAGGKHERNNFIPKMPFWMT